MASCKHPPLLPPSSLPPTYGQGSLLKGELGGVNKGGIPGKSKNDNREEGLGMLSKVHGTAEEPQAKRR